MKKTIFFPLFLLCLSIPAFLPAQDMAYPVEGDGILSFLRRWNRVDTTYVSEFIDLNKDRLNSQGSLELGTVYLIPVLHPGDVYPAAGVAYQPTEPSIFGPEFSSLPIRSDKLKGACFYIESGHGGPDPGAVSTLDGQELHEDEYAYDIALRLARNLMSEGATVYIIIQDENDGIRNGKYLNNSNTETCLGEPIPKSQLDRLKQRTDAINQLYERDKNLFYYFRAISIHVDSRNKKKQIDVFFYHSIDPKSKALSYTLRDVFQNKYDTFQPGRGFQGIAEHRDLYLLRHLKPVSTLVEVGNIQNEFDRRRIILENNRQALANWLALGFIADFEKRN